MKVLVTGACGFIGSHLTNFLTKKGFRVVALDVKPKSDCFLNLKADRILQTDLRNWMSWQTILEEENIEQYDAIIIATAHRVFDFDLIKKHAKLIIDTRGVYKEERENIIKA